MSAKQGQEIMLLLQVELFVILRAMESCKIISQYVYICQICDECKHMSYIQLCALANMVTIFFTQYEE